MSVIMSYLFPELQCIDCQEKVQFIILSEDQQQRLLCGKCYLNNRVNMFYISDVFLFAEQCKKQENQIEKEMVYIKNKWNLLKSKVEKNISDLNDLIKNLSQFFDAEPKITSNDAVSICLDKKNNSSKEELLSMANQLEKLLFEQNRLETNRYKILNQQLDFIKYSIKELENNLEGQVQSVQSQSNLISNNSSLSNQSSVYLQVQFNDVIETIQTKQKHINVVQFNHQNTLLAIGGSIDQETACYLSLFQFNNSNFKKACNLNGLKSDVISCCFCETDNSILAGEKNGQIVIWKQNIKDKPNLWYISQTIKQFQTPINTIKINLKLNILAVGSEYLYIFKQNSVQSHQWEDFYNLKTNYQGAITHLSFSHSSKKQLLITASKDPLILLYEHTEKIDKYQLIIKLNIESPVHFVKFYNEVDIYTILQSNQSIYFQYQQENQEYDRLVCSLNQFGKIQTVEFNENQQNLFLKIQNQNQVLSFFVSQRSNLSQMNQQIVFQGEKISLSDDGKYLLLASQYRIKVYPLTYQ